MNILRQIRQISLAYRPQFYKTTIVEQPQLKRRTITPIYPPPGLNLQLPDWPVDKFMLRIGNGCSEYADKFETLQQVFEANRIQLKEKGIPACIRRYLLTIKEQLRRGVLTFEYLDRRTCLELESSKSKGKTNKK